MYHKSVLVNEVLEYLALKPHGVYIDATFGGGGHTRAILEAEPTCRVIAFDWDIVAIETNGYPLMEEFPGRLQIIWSNFAQLDKHLKKINAQPVDGILADFGTSQFQIKERAGFSFAADTPLDMRMSPAHQLITAQDIVNRASEKELITIFLDYGQEFKARAIARAIVQQREQKALKTTGQLAQLIEKIIPRAGSKIHPATKVFQALRIAVNKELDNIETFLKAAIPWLKVEGRLVCISFHSLEDRLVKQYYREQERKSIGNNLTAKVVTASQEEIEHNPSSRSAKLRAFEKI